MNRTTRTLVVLSALAAVGLQAVLVGRAWPALPAITALAGVCGLVVGYRRPGLPSGVILAAGYVAPVLLGIAAGGFYSPYLLPWMTMLLAVTVGTPATGWSFPPSWRLPLIGWTMVIAVGWPLVVLREIDFSLSLLNNYTLPNTGVGVSPPSVTVGLLDLAMAHLVGILWFDWLFRRYGDDGRDRFQHQIILPLGGSALVASLVGIYQGVVDITWMSGGAWAHISRAAGTLVDANAFGMVAAFWAPALFVLGTVNGSRGARAIGAAGFFGAWAGLWASGSRTALLTAAIGTFVLAVAGSRQVRWRREGRSAVFPLAAGVLLVIGFITLVPSHAVSPVQRIANMFPSASSDGARTVARALWRRGGYGLAADRMIQDHPLVGVGWGSYYPLQVLYSAEIGRPVLAFDNAQSWYRHQLAELGLIGSIPWILWVILFAGLLFRTRGQAERRLPAAVVKGTLVAFGVMSMVGMPAQNPAVVLTFWTFAFWYLRLVDAPELRLAASPAGGHSWFPWAVIWILVLLYAAGTLHLARTDLRVPYRAVRGDWRYAYGIEDAQNLPKPGEFRWTARKAIVNIPAERAWLKLTVWPGHPDARERPIEAKIWTYGRELVLHAKRWDGSPLTRYIEAPEGRRRVLVETWVNRTWTSPEDDEAEIRERGLALAWEFVDAGPMAGWRAAGRN